jgi:cell division transport system ATP-binding protein
MIQLDGVWKSFAGEAALRGVSLAVAKGDALLLTGASGAGKTTLLRLIFGAARPDRGELRVAGRDLGRLSGASIPYVRRNIGVIFQDFKLLGARTALANVSMPLEVLGMAAREVRTRAATALEAVGLGAKLHTRASALSGGEQQRVAVARAIVNEPAILLADEPTGNLDPELAQELLGLLETIHRRGTTIVLATHDPAVVAFGVSQGWRCARLIAGELVDVDVPAARPARTDEETEGFATREAADSTEVVRVARA